MLFYICFVAQERSVGRSGRAAEKGAKRNLTLGRVGERSKDEIVTERVEENRSPALWEQRIGTGWGGVGWGRGAGLVAKKGLEQTGLVLTRSLHSESCCLEVLNQLS